MKRLVLALGSLVVAGVLIPASVAAPVAVANGGGNGTFDGTTAGSHFGFGVLYGTRAGGQFQCNMAGNAAFDGLREMGLEGTVASGTVNLATGTATFSGTATLHVNGHASTIGFEVEVHAGGPLVGWLHLTVFDSPFGPVFTFPLEHVLTGQITVH
jgi:opacity protein-like surface antigen